MSDELIQVIEALWWVAMYCAVNSEERPLAVCIELSATPHGGQPRLTRHVYQIDWERWPQVAPALTEERCRQEVVAACMALLPDGRRRFTYEWSALCSGAKHDFITLGGGKGEIKSEAPGAARLEKSASCR
jgi:hypothetical protein